MQRTDNNSIITLDSGRQWPRVVVMAWVHGNERSWVKAIEQFLTMWIQPIRWCVTFIVANIQALESNSRQVQYNMNRSFGQPWPDCYETQRAAYLCSILEQNDILLDLHNTIWPSAKPFLISDYPEFDTVFDCRAVVWELDPIHPGGSDGFMNSIGKIGLCLECGSVVDDLSTTTQFAMSSVINFLQKTWVISGETIWYADASRYSVQSIYKAQFWEFRLMRRLAEFEVVKTGEIVGKDGGKDVVFEKDVCVLFARDTQQVGDECFVVVSEY